MKIERIADNAINIYISSKDLASRNLDVSTLKEGTHDFDKLIWDAIDHANIEFGHEFEDRQLNVVNKPDGDGGLILKYFCGAADCSRVRYVEYSAGSVPKPIS